MRSVKYLDYVIYWSLILIPPAMSISPAPVSVFTGLLIAAFLAKKLIKRERLLCRTAVNIPLFLFFLITCLSLFHSVNLKDSLRGGVFRLLQYIFVFFIALQEVKDKKHIFKIILSMTFGLLLASLDSIWQVSRGRDFIRGYAPVMNIGLARATASFKDPNTLGIYLSAIAPALLALTLYYWKGVKKAIFALVSITVLCAIGLTYSRPTLLAIYIAMITLGAIKRSKMLVISLLILAVASPLLMPRSIKAFAGSVNYNPLRFMCNDDRIAVYCNSLNMIRAHPFMGLGANTYMKNYKKYKEFPEYRNVVTQDYMYAHNMYLQMAAEIGLAGLAIFFWLLYKLFRESLRIYRRLQEGFLKVVSLSLFLCLLAFLVNGLTESSLYYARVALIFWYLAGLNLALGKFIDAHRA